MTTVIKKGEVMRDEMNRVVDHELQRHQEPSAWDEILFAILAEFENESNTYPITIRGKEVVSDSPQFVNQMRLTLGQLRAMKRP